MKEFKSIFMLISAFLIFYACTETEVHRDFYSNGTLKEEYSTKKGNFVGKHKAFYSNGGVRTTGTYSKGKMTGLWQYFYEGGQRQSIEEYSKGKLIDFNYWDQKGNLLVKNGTGVVKRYNSSGLLESKMSYVNYKFDGLCETWFSNGMKATEIYYDCGKPVGIWRFWDQNGKLIKTEKH